LWLLFKPIIGAIIFGSILAGSFYPLFMKIHQKTKRSKSVSSLITCLVIVLIIIIPTIYLTVQLSKETIHLYQNIKSGFNDQSVNTFLFGEGYIAGFIKNVSGLFNMNLSSDPNTNLNPDLNMELIQGKLFEVIKNISGIMFDLFNTWLSNILNFFFNVLIMLLVVYSFFTNGDKLKAFFLRLSPLPDDQEELIINKFNQMNYVTLVCNGLGGVLQGVLAGIGFWLAGLSSVFLWMTVMMILAFIPLVGISVVTIPACIYLWIKGKILASIILFIFCITISLVTENVFKPRFIGNLIEINSLFVLFTIIGGMSVFGMAGIFYGPLIGIIFLTAVDIYHSNYAPIPTK